MRKEKIIEVTTGVALFMCFVGGVAFASSQNDTGERTAEEKIAASQKANTKVSESSGFVPMGKEMVDNTTDCNKLQHMFDTAYEGHNFVTDKVDALDYVDNRMRNVGCY